MKADERVSRAEGEEKSRIRNLLNDRLLRDNNVYLLGRLPGPCDGRLLPSRALKLHREDSDGEDVTSRVW
jgi:hypothetical protein